MNEQLEKILSAVYALLGFVVLVVTPLLFIIVSRLDAKDGKKKSSDVKDKFELAVRAYHKMKNYGTVQPVPDIPQDIEKGFLKKWLERYDNKTDAMDFTESRCLEIWGGSPPMYRKLMDKYSAEGVVKRKRAGATRGPNAAWIAAHDKRGTLILMRKKLTDLSPADGRSIPKMQGNTDD